MHIKTIHILCLSLVFCLVACTASGENAATSEARQITVVARATQMARSLRGTDVARAAHSTATAQVLQEKLRQAESWPLLIQDPFDDNALEWSVGEDTGEYADIYWQINGTYLWQATAKQGFVWWNRAEIESVADFYASVDTRQISGVESGQVGMFFRQTSDSNYCAFLVQNNGQFSLYWHDDNGWTTLIDWTPTEVFRPGEVNRLGVLSQNEQVALSINGQWVAIYPTQDDPAGWLGLMIGLDNEGDEGIFEFDNLEVRVPELPQP